MHHVVKKVDEPHYVLPACSCFHELLDFFGTATMLAMYGDEGRTSLRWRLITSYLTGEDKRKRTQWFTHNRPKLIRDNSAARLIYSQYSPAITDVIYAVWHNTSFHWKRPITHCKI